MWWWIAFAVAGVVTLGGATATASPWTPCPPCDGKGTHRDPATRRFTGHCRRCRGTGRVEAPARRFWRALSGGKLYPLSPEREHGDRQTYAGWAPFAGRHPGGAPRRGWPRR